MFKIRLGRFFVVVMEIATQLQSEAAAEMHGMHLAKWNLVYICCPVCVSNGYIAEQLSSGS